MEFNAANADELVKAIRAANAAPYEAHIINLSGNDDDYKVDHSEEELFGGNAFPIITGNITIYGNGRRIARVSDTPFRFFAVNAKSGQTNAKLTLKRVILVNGNSNQSGGGAIVNDGELVLDECVLRLNQGTLGGAIYNGDGQSATIVNSEFMWNYASEKGGALYSSETSQLLIRNSRFYENRAPHLGTSLWIAKLENVQLEASDVRDGLVIGQIYHGDLQLTRSREPIRLGSLESQFQAEENAARLAEIWRENAQHQPVFRPEPGWWETYTASPAVEAILKTLEQMDWQIARQTLDSLHSSREFDTLLNIARALRAQEIKAGGQGYLLAGLYHHILTLFASSPNRDSIDAAFNLFDIIQGGVWDYRSLARTLATGLNAQAADDLFRQRGQVVLQQFNNPDPLSRARLYADVLTALVEELAIRGINSDEIPSIKAFLAKKRELQPSTVSDDLLWLPLKRLDMEQQIRQDKPEYTANSGHTRFSPYDDFSTWPIATVIDLPPYQEIVDLEERRRIRIALEELGGNLEARTFRFETPLNPEQITADFLVSLKLACLQATRHIRFEATTPDYVISLLFALACNGGPYGGGVGPAYGRLYAWQSMGGLVGAIHGESVETIADIAQQGHWFSFLPVNNWFSGEMIDVGIAVLRPDGRTLAVVAASATD